MLEEYFSRRCGRTFIQFGKGLRYLTSPFHIYFCADTYIADALHNRAISSLTSDVDPPPRPWPGTVLIMKLSGHGRYDYIDFKEEDIADIREYFALRR